MINAQALLSGASFPPAFEFEPEQPAPAERALAWALFSSSIRTGRGPGIPELAGRFGFIPGPRDGAISKSDAGSYSPSLFIQAAKNSNFAAFGQMAEFIAKNSPEPSCALRAAANSAFMDRSAVRYSAEQLACQNQAPVAAAFACDSAEALAAMLDNPECCAALLAAEPAPGKNLCRTDSLLFHALAMDAPRCALLLVSIPEFRDPFFDASVPVLLPRCISIASDGNSGSLRPLPAALECARSLVRRHGRFAKAGARSCLALIDRLVALQPHAQRLAGPAHDEPNWAEELAESFASRDLYALIEADAPRWMAQLAAQGCPTERAVELAFERLSGEQLARFEAALIAPCAFQAPSKSPFKL